MGYIIASIFGMIGGALCVYLAMEVKRRQLSELQQGHEENARNIADKLNALRRRELEMFSAVDKKKAEVDQLTANLHEEIGRFRAQAVSYKELSDENAILKRDLNNLSINLRKIELDRDAQRERQDSIDQKCSDLASRYLKENVKWISTSLNANNYTNCKQRLLDVIRRCRDIGFQVSPEEEERLASDLKREFEKAVRAALEREEQARIKARIREEQMREREFQKEMERLERERAAIASALERALAEAKDAHSAEIENLRRRLAEAEERSKRALSQAQLTKSGYVYVVSNVGSFGDGVFKIGMTRRLEPYDRVRELGDASVPFPFDVHMMISCDDAPRLENEIHRVLHKKRVNKINPRKEFFRTDFDEIRRIVETNHGEVDYVADAEALEYRQSTSMSDEDLEYIESVYSESDDDDASPEVEV